MASRTIYIIPSNNQRNMVKQPVVVPKPVVGAIQPNIIRKAPLLSPRSSIGGNMISRQTATILPQASRQPQFRKAPLTSIAPQMGTKRPANNNDNITIDEVVDLITPLSNSYPSPPRKRERLTHLSMEEKLNRRKMKNRVAAQTARDRKKERVSKLEKALQLLLEENSKLRSDNRSLINENRTLKKSQSTMTTSPMSASAAASVGTIESAVGTGTFFGGDEAVQGQVHALSADYFCNNDELQKIFDDLFNDPEDPIDFDRFCNEVIEEELAKEEEQPTANNREASTSPATVTSLDSQDPMEFYNAMPDNVLELDGYHQDGGCVTEAYGTVGAPTTCLLAVSPSQQVPSPSMYTNHLSPSLSIKEEANAFYPDHKYAPPPTSSSSSEHIIWDDYAATSPSLTFIEDGAFEDSTFLTTFPSYEDVLIPSENLWFESTIEA